MSPRKLKPKEKRTYLAITLLFLGIIVLTFLETYLQGVELSSRYITTNIVVFALVNINIILLMILVLLVLRNLIKLYFEHRQKTLGSKFKSKLIVAFTALSIIPAGILFVVSLNLINKSIKNWFEIQVEEVLIGTTEISRNYYQSIGQNNLHHARFISQEITRRRLISSYNQDKLSVLITTKQKEYNLGMVEVFDAELQRVISVANPSIPAADLKASGQESLQKVLQGQEITLIDSAGKGDMIRNLVPIMSWMEEGQVAGALVVNRYVPASLVQQVGKITSTYENYMQSKVLKNPIRISYQMTLGMITLLIVFSATWFAFYLARLITVPIQKLAEGTHRISEGELDFKINHEATDELGMLIGSFNRMTDDLRANKLNLESAYRNLEKTNLELEQRRLYIETVLDNIATGVVSLDQEGRVTTMNKAAQSMLGLSASKSRNSKFSKVFGKGPYKEIMTFIEDLTSQDINWLERKIDLSLEDDQLNLLLIGSNTFGEKLDYTGSVIVLENLTDLIKAQRVAAWREVARRIAHEIKNPLTPIKLSAQRLRKKYYQKGGDFEEIFDEGTQMIIGQVDELKRLVDEFSLFARMPSSKPMPTDIHSILENTLKLYKEMDKNVAIDTSFHPESLMALVDPEQMKRAFMNVIDNSIEATDGKGSIWIETVYDQNSQSIKIIFKDTGRGIPPEVRDKLFAPYFSTKKEGTGLGLSIVSSIVSDHHGYIRIKNNSPRGTIFIIELPALRGERIKA
jgi:two-component system nitrogen regulation sensor histidine kinase NtrY